MSKKNKKNFTKARQPDLRKKFKVEIQITHRELCDLEDFLVCSPLCKKHNISLLKEKDWTIVENSWQSCKDCKRVQKKWWTSSWNIQSKLWRQFEKKARWN